MSSTTKNNESVEFSTSTRIGGGDPGRDYNPVSMDAASQPASGSGSNFGSATDTGDSERLNEERSWEGKHENYGGGIGDRAQGAGAFGEGGVVNDVSNAGQYGSSGGY